MQNTVANHANRDWLKQLLAFKPAKWVWGRSIRAGIGVGLPLAVGIATGHVAESLFVSMGSLTQAPGERDEAYQFTFLKILLSAICGSIGLLLDHHQFSQQRIGVRLHDDFDVRHDCLVQSGYQVVHSTCWFLHSWISFLCAFAWH